jgi:DivIVA domain-containing protein
VELRRKRSSPVIGASVAALGAVLLLFALRAGAIGLLIVGAIVVLIGITLVVGALRPFRFQIGDAGMTVRRNGLDRLVPWPEAAAIILDEPAPSGDSPGPTAPRLLLVPADPTSFEQPSTAQDPLGDRPCLVLLDFAEVRDTPDEVAAALVRFAGDRFTDLRRLLAAEALGRPDFTVALRGYEIGPVDDLIRRGRLALIGTDRPRRVEVSGEIQAALGSFPLALRGYDRSQVDSFLRELSARLAG